jgi:hypothetical protein
MQVGNYKCGPPADKHSPFKYLENNFAPFDYLLSNTHHDCPNRFAYNFCRYISLFKLRASGRTTHDYPGAQQ